MREYEDDELIEYESRINNLEAKIAKLKRKNEELIDEIEDLRDKIVTLTNDLWIKDIIKIIPKPEDISMGDAIVINNMLLQYFKENGIRYEDYT